MEDKSKQEIISEFFRISEIVLDALKDEQINSPILFVALFDILVSQSQVKGYKHDDFKELLYEMIELSKSKWEVEREQNDKKKNRRKDN